MARAVIFDVDGTLVSFKFDVEGTRRAMIQRLSQLGLDTNGLTLTTPTQQVLQHAKQSVAKRRGMDFVAVKRELYNILDASELESNKASMVFPGTRELLLRLRQNSFKLAVLTNSGRPAAYDVLERFGLIECFEFVLTRDDVEEMKPSPEGMLVAVDRLDLPREEVVYVGDGLLDLQAARSAGLRAVSVATGNYSLERLRQEGAQLVISSLSELPPALGL